MRTSILKDCEAAHVAINWKKSSLEGVVSLTHLGIGVDVQHNRFTVPAQKAVTVREMIGDLMSRKGCPISQPASLAGQLTSLQLPIGPLTALFCRAIRRDMDEARSWSSTVVLNYDVLDELYFWLTAGRSEFSSQTPIRVRQQAYLSTPRRQDGALGWLSLPALLPSVFPPRRNDEGPPPCEKCWDLHALC